MAIFCETLARTKPLFDTTVIPQQLYKHIATQSTCDGNGSGIWVFMFVINDAFP